MLYLADKLLYLFKRLPTDFEKFTDYQNCLAVYRENHMIDIGMFRVS